MTRGQVASVPGLEAGKMRFCSLPPVAPSSRLRARAVPSGAPGGVPKQVVQQMPLQGPHPTPRLREEHRVPCPCPSQQCIDPTLGKKINVGKDKRKICSDMFVIGGAFRCTHTASVFPPQPLTHPTAPARGRAECGASGLCSVRVRGILEAPASSPLHS